MHIEYKKNKHIYILCSKKYYNGEKMQKRISASFFLTTLLLSSNYSFSSENIEPERSPSSLPRSYATKPGVSADVNLNTVFIAPVEDASERSIGLEASKIFVETGYNVLRALYQKTGLESINAYPLKAKIPGHQFDQGALYPNREFVSPAAYVQWAIQDTDMDREEKLMKITSIMWALDDMAKKQGESYERGSYTVLDPGHALYEFLIGYVTQVNNVEDPKNVWPAVSGNPFAYQRDPKKGGSSHHKHHTPESQFGIDMRFKAHETIYGILPFGQRHILFGKLHIPGSTEPLTFIKFEEAGLGTITEKIHHGLNFIKSIKKRFNEQNDGIDLKVRKEHTVLVTLAEKYKTLTRDDTQGLFIYQMLGHACFQGEIGRKKRADFVKTIETLYPSDSSKLRNVRVGNEVMLDLSIIASTPISLEISLTGSYDIIKRIDAQKRQERLERRRSPSPSGASSDSFTATTSTLTPSPKTETSRSRSPERRRAMNFGRGQQIFALPPE